jgi:hypothetical protein
MGKNTYLRQYGAYLTFTRKKDGLQHYGYSSYMAEEKSQAYWMAWKEYGEIIKKSWKISNIHIVEII